MPGCFITFEGLDGSGKTTQMKLLAAWLESRGQSTVMTRNPGGTPLGDRLRAVLLDSRTESDLGAISPHAELALMFADRAQSIAQVIRPAVAAGKVVLCDRFTDSSEAYQGGGRQLGSSTVLAIHAAVCENHQPDLTILLLPPLDVSLPRARRRNQRHTERHGEDENRFEREGDAFYSRIHAAYLAIAAREPSRVALIPDDAPIDAIQAKIVAIVSDKLGL